MTMPCRGTDSIATTRGLKKAVVGAGMNTCCCKGLPFYAVDSRKALHFQILLAAAESEASESASLARRCCTGNRRVQPARTARKGRWPGTACRLRELAPVRQSHTAASD